MAELTDAVNALAKSAEKGDPGAKQILQRLFAALDRAKDATGKIEIVRA